jgi:hypothetical protein
MGDFFLPQIDDFFTEGVCFHTSLVSEEWGSPNRPSPIL